jgi:UDP-N-acetylmuramate--alanine ligase
LKNDFIDEISNVLRDTDQIWMSEIYYAGGTVSKDISANDLIEGIAAKGGNAFFVKKRENFPEEVKKHLSRGVVVLLMGARDPSLEKFSAYVFNQISYIGKL